MGIRLRMCDGDDVVRPYPTNRALRSRERSVRRKDALLSSCDKPHANIYEYTLYAFVCVCVFVLEACCCVRIGVDVVVHAAKRS